MKIDVNPHFANALVSWRTSLAGVFAFVALNAPQFIAYLQANQNIDMKTFWFGFSIMVLGVIARDGTVSSEEAGAKPNEPSPVVLPAPGSMPVSFIIFAVLCLSMLTGCVSTTSSNRKKGEESEAEAYEQAYANLSDQYDAQEKANIVNHTRRLDLELKADMQSLEIQSRLDAIKWTPAAIAAETTRLQALHDSRIAAYKDSLDKFRALKTKNEEVNRGTARKIRAALNPPVQGPLVNQSSQIQSATGAQQPLPLIQP